MRGSLVIYDLNGMVVGTVDHQVQYENGEAIGLVDFVAHEEAGGKLRDIVDMTSVITVPRAVMLEAYPELAEAIAAVEQDFERWKERVEPAARRFIPAMREEVVDQILNSRTLPGDHPYRVARERVAGSGTWPEWLGGNALQHMRVRVDRRHKQPIRSLTHVHSGHIRDRKAIEAAIEARVKPERERAKAEKREQRPVDIRDLTGGPGAPLLLDYDGRTKAKPPSVERKALPLVGRPTKRADDPGGRLEPFAVEALRATGRG